MNTRKELVMGGHGDTSRSTGSEIPKATEKKIKGHVSRLSDEYNLKDGPSPANYPRHMDTGKANKFRSAVNESWKSTSNKIHQEYRSSAIGARDDIEKQIELAQKRQEDQKKVDQLRKSLHDNLDRRSEGE